MHIESFKFSEVPFFSKFLSDYTNSVLPEEILPPYPMDMNGIKAQIEEPYPLKIPREDLIKALFLQYSEVAINDEVRNNIDKLGLDTTFTVTTAHQLSFLCGPLYYVIKIANAIAYARKLKLSFPDYDFVPVYWMGGEDHDFEEVNHIYLFGKKVTWESEQTGPVGRFHLDGVKSVIDEVFEILGDSKPDGIEELIKKAYSHKRVKDANRELVNGLFGQYGLVIVSGDDVILKNGMKEIFKEEMIHQASFPLLQKQSGLLVKTGYHAQASGREINLFHLGDTHRFRIEPQGENYLIGEKVYTSEQLFKELDEHPEAFSPNVILRPILQQSVLPNIAFIGGGSEVAYWFQLPTIFKYYQVRYPLVIPRTSVMLIRDLNYKKMQKLEMSVTDLFRDKDQLKNRFLETHVNVMPSLENESKEIEKILGEVQEKATDIDQTLDKAIGADIQRIKNVLEQIEGKMLRAIKKNNAISLNQIDSLFNSLFPENVLQERHDNFLNFYSVYGQKFIDFLVAHLSVIDQDFVVVTESEN
ncbi:MAG: bacillithiol biosynthesis cysteine-adding enzyme BshC [Chitinophagales bacterium]|nr:bacillithiol biosynthesis cysteine-adding enzyme BshC [Chitinophagales bacterium]